MKKILLVATMGVVGLVAIFLSTGGPIDPEAFEPPPSPAMDGVLAVNEALRASERLADGQVHGPEDVAVDAFGQIYAGTEDGRIVRYMDEVDASARLGTFAVTGGRPLGLHFDADGNLVVADAARGLLSIDRGGDVTLLADEADGLPFGFTDDLDIASDGSVYFSDASWRHGHEHYLYDLLEARPHGRLLRYDPATGQTEVLLSDLYFANGVALSRDEDFVLVNETYRYRTIRYWLRGPRAGESEVFLDNLPGFPDGVSSNRRDTFWLALFTIRNPRMDRLHPSAFLKRQMAKLPRVFWPQPAPYGLVLAVSEDGRIERSLQDSTGEVIPQVTSAEEVNGFLYLGNLNRDFIGRLAL